MKSLTNIQHDATFKYVFSSRLNLLPESIASTLVRGETVLLSSEEQENRDKIANLLLGEAWQVTLAIQLLQNLPRLTNHLSWELWIALASHDWYEEDEIPFGAHAGEKIETLEREELTDALLSANKLCKEYNEANFVKSLRCSLLRREMLLKKILDSKARKHEYLSLQIYDAFMTYIQGLCSISSRTYLPSECVFAVDYRKLSNRTIYMMLNNASENGFCNYSTVNISFLSEKDILPAPYKVIPSSIGYDGSSVFYYSPSVYFNKADVLDAIGFIPLKCDFPDFILK